MLLAFLFIKHFIVDFLLQPEYMYKNKGDLSHPGGYIHAFLHGFVSLIIMLLLANNLIIALLLAVMEWVWHFTIDYWKVNLSKNYDMKHEVFWILLGLDQLLHNLTYVFMDYTLKQF